MNEAPSRLFELLSRKVDKVPDGWRTARQIAAETGDTVTRVDCAIRRLLDEGKVAAKVFRIPCGPNGATRKVTHYK